MITIRVSAQVNSDRRVLITLPPEVPVGRSELTVSIATPQVDEPRRPRSSLADWAEDHAEHWGDRLRATDVEGFTGRGV